LAALAGLAFFAKSRSKHTSARWKNSE
jgi:hypothetical protein